VQIIAHRTGRHLGNQFWGTLDVIIGTEARLAPTGRVNEQQRVRLRLIVQVQADGAIVAALHYRFVPSEENNKAFGRVQSFVAGTPTNVQFMVKDSTKYAATGGWGFGHFNTDRKPVADSFMKTCFPCHQAVKDRDLVFTHYAP